MDPQEDQEERGPATPAVEEELKDCGDSPRHLYPQLDDAFEAFEEGNEEARDSMHSGEENVASAPCVAEESSDGGGEDVGLAVPLPTAPPPPAPVDHDDEDDDDFPNTTRSPPNSSEMQPYTERQILGLYTNEQMEHNAQFVDMFLTEQVYIHM